MDKKGSAKNLVITVACIFTVSVGLLHGRKVTTTVIEPSISLSKQDIIDLVSTALIAGDIDKAITTLKHIRSSSALTAVQEILLSNPTNVSEENRMILTLGILPELTRHDQKELFNTLLVTTEFKPFLYHAQNLNSDRAVSIVSELGKKKGIYKRLMVDSYVAAIDKNDVKGVQKLYSLSIRPDAANSGALLVYAIRKDRDIDFVPFFVQKLSVDPNYTNDGRKTLLMYAVEKNSSPMVRALLEVGADSNKILHPAVGSARQIAFEKNYTALENIMSTYQ